MRSAKQPTFGDSFLNTISYDGIDNDVTSRVSRGDMIRVGHQIIGETFRVSIDLSRSFTSQILPLAEVRDGMKEAFLSKKALIHSTLEVQTITISVNNSNSNQTSSMLNSFGLRLKFGLEKTLYQGIGMCLFSLNDNTQAIRSLKECLKIKQLNFTINDDDVAETQFYIIVIYINIVQ